MTWSSINDFLSLKLKTQRYGQFVKKNSIILTLIQLNLLRTRRRIKDVTSHDRINPQRKRLFHPPAEFSQNAHIKAWKNTSASMIALKLILKILGRVGRTRVALVPKVGHSPRLAATFAKWFVGGQYFLQLP